MRDGMQAFAFDTSETPLNRAGPIGWAIAFASRQRALAWLSIEEAMLRSGSARNFNERGGA